MQPVRTPRAASLCFERSSTHRLRFAVGHCCHRKLRDAAHLMGLTELPLAARPRHCCSHLYPSSRISPPSRRATGPCDELARSMTRGRPRQMPRSLMFSFSNPYTRPTPGGIFSSMAGRRSKFLSVAFLIAGLSWRRQWRFGPSGRASLSAAGMCRGLDCFAAAPLAHTCARLCRPGGLSLAML